jgi:hypothetical protein
MGALHDPVQIRVLRRVAIHRCVPDAAGHMLGGAALHMIEERLVATHPAHDEPREEKAQQKPPAPGIEASVEEHLPLGPGAGDEDVVDRAPGMDKGQEPGAEDAEVAFELAHAACAMFRHIT